MELAFALIAASGFSNKNRHSGFFFIEESGFFYKVTLKELLYKETNYSPPPCFTHTYFVANDFGLYASSDAGNLVKLLRTWKRPAFTGHY